MKQTAMTWGWIAGRLVYLVIATLLFAGGLSVIFAGAQTDASNQLDWAAPSTMALRRVSDASSIQNESSFLENTDCSLLTYRMVNTEGMRTGCFSSSVFGLMESSSGIIIFNGTDEAIKLLPYASQQVLVPWQNSLELIVLDTLSTGGSYISFYKNPAAATQDIRDLATGQLLSKQLKSLPEVALRDPSGERLVINPLSLTFSDDGSWLVAETRNGSFVRVNLATQEVVAFAHSYTISGSPAYLPSRIAITDNGRFVAISNDFAGEFKIFDLQNCDGVVNNLRPQSCAAYDYRPYVASHIVDLRSVRHVRFVSDSLLSFEARTDVAEATGIYLLTPAASVDFLSDYIGLGDSYTAGEGAFDYLVGTDTRDNMCHLSRHSYPLLLASELIDSAGAHSVACSGAVINDIGSTSGKYRGQVGGISNWDQLQQNDPQLVESVLTNFIPGYIAQHRFVQRWQPRVITVSVGGNDIGFGAILESCVTPRLSLSFSGNNCFRDYEDRIEVQTLIDRTVPRLTSLYRQLQKASPSAIVYAIGYPQIADATGNCANNVKLSRSELEFAADLIDYLNQSIEKAAVEAAVTYIDISQALVGYRLCEAASYAVAVNGVTAGKDAGPFGTKLFGKESFHPNAFGQSLIKQAILGQLQSHSRLSATSSSSIPKSTALASGPKSGRQIYLRLPAGELTDTAVKRDETMTVKTTGVTYGLKSNAPYTLRLDGPNGPIVGTALSNADGDISTNAFIPVTTTPGGHTIDVTGLNQTDAPIRLTQPIYILASDTDADGDSIPNDLDTCPGALNSKIDEDVDGIDDSCDSLIGQPPATPGSTNGTVSPPAPTIVSTFSTGTVAATSSTGTQRLSGTTHVLGMATSNPQRPGITLRRPARVVSPNLSQSPHIQAVKAFSWRSWILLPAATWVVLIGGLLPYWVVRRREHFRTHAALL